MPAQRTALPVRDGETSWTPDEIAELRQALVEERDQLAEEVRAAETVLADMLRDAGDTAGDDQADSGSSAAEREHELVLARGARTSLHQCEVALARIDDGSYGTCESCGQPVGKARLQAFPRAALCLDCKRRSERR